MYVVTTSLSFFISHTHTEEIKKRKKGHVTVRRQCNKKTSNVFAKAINLEIQKKRYTKKNMASGVKGSVKIIRKILDR